MRAAGVVRHHPAERARAAAARIRWEEQSVLAERLLEVGEHDAGLDDGLEVRTVDLDDLPHARERHDDPAASGDRAAGLAGPRAARDDRGACLIRDPHRGDDVRRRLGDNHDVGTVLHPQRPERRVVRVRLERRRVIDHAVAGQHREQSLDQCVTRLDGHAMTVSY